MPFVVICGFPCSGKSRRTNELCEFLQKNFDKEVHVISDHTVGVNKNELYGDPKKEKEVRSTLKSAVQRAISKESVCVLDSANYIKGYRYELFCITKSAQTPHCVIHCEVTQESASQWNQARPKDEQYTTEILEALIMRFETPDSRNRWDSPLFLVHPDEDLPCQQIYDALFHRKAPPPNQSTQSQPLSSTNFLHELDKTTQSIVTVVLDAQKTSVPGDTVLIPGATEKVKLLRPLTLAELQRIRRQYITYTKMHPIEDTQKIANMFVKYLNNSIS